MPLDKRGKDLSVEGYQYWFTIFQKLRLLWSSEFSHLVMWLEVRFLATWIFRWIRSRILL